MSAVSAPRVVSAQQAAGPRERAGLPYGSTYLWLGHWAYDYLNVMVARGHVTDLAPLLQPYRRIDIANAVLAAEAEGQLSREELEWVAEIKRELADEVELLEGGRAQDVTFHGELGAGLKALTQTHRDPLRPQGDEKLFPTFRVYMSGEAPLAAAEVGGRWDNHLLNDPQYQDGRVIEFRECDPLVAECAYRPEDAYLELQLPYVRLFFGRTYRNWGLPGRDGMLVSAYAYSYDHVAYRLGNERISLTGLYAPLSDFPGDTARHFASHRFDWRILDNLVVAFGESAVYGGPNRRLDFSLTNPLLPWEISGGAQGTERNSLGMAEVWWRIFDDLVTYGSFVVDNTSVGNEGARREGFVQYAAAFGLQLPTLAPRLALRADFTVVSSLAYRSRVDFWEYYSVDGIGLAHDKTDAIVLSLRTDWFPRRKLILRPRLELMWKGEDDLRQPFPEDAFTTHDLLLAGVIEKTIRPSLGGRYHHLLGELRWDLGLNLVKNDGNQPRDWRVKGVAQVELDVRRRF